MSSKKLKLNFHIIFIVLVVAIIVVVLARLSSWNKRSIEVDTDVAEDAYEMECQDYYVFPDAEARNGRIDNGVEDILIIGNSILTNVDGKNTVLDALKQSLDANIYPLVADNTKITSNQKYELSITGSTDGVALYRVVDQLVNGKNIASTQVREYSETIFNDNAKARADEYINIIDTIDLNDIDTVIIMYSLLDYFNMSPTLVLPNEDIDCYYGALYSSIKLLQDNYPHLSIIISSVVPGYFYDDDGNIILATQKDLGAGGNSSEYANIQYHVATKCCVSFIDNYFYKINENNITEYIEGFYLSNKGVDLVANHMIDFLHDRTIK